MDVRTSPVVVRRRPRHLDFAIAAHDGELDELEFGDDPLLDQADRHTRSTRRRANSSYVGNRRVRSSGGRWTSHGWKSQATAGSAVGQATSSEYVRRWSRQPWRMPTKRLASATKSLVMRLATGTEGILVTARPG